MFSLTADERARDDALAARFSAESKEIAAQLDRLKVADVAEDAEE